MLADIWYRLGRSIIRLFTLFVLRFDIQRKSSLPAGPIILTANHPSIIDPAVITTLIPSHVSILILDTLFKVPVFGRSLKWCGHIPVIEGQGRNAFDQACRVLKSGGTLAIFPEGVISPTVHTIQKPHSGIARMALCTGAPVIPIGISLDPACIRLIHTRVAGKSEVGTWYFHGPYAVTVGEPMLFRGDPEDRELVRQVGEQIMQRITILTAESRLRIESAKKPNRLVVVPIKAFWYILFRSLNPLGGTRII